MLRLMRRAFTRANVTPYDAAYVALAEILGCALWTADQRLTEPPAPPAPSGSWTDPGRSPPGSGASMAAAGRLPLAQTGTAENYVSRA